MIEVEGQFTLTVKVLKGGGDSGVVINDEDFIDLVVVEEAGNQLPTFEMNLRLVSEKEVAHFHEGNKIQLQMGNRLLNDKGLNEVLVDGIFVVSKTVIKREGQQVRRLKITGFLDALGYSTQRKMTATDSVCGIEAIQSVAERNKLKVKTNIEPSAHKQIWLQPNITDKRFVSEIWKHTFVDDSFPIVALTAKTEMLVQDPKKLLQSPPKWCFTQTGESDGAGKPVTYRGDFEWTNASGFINHWAGYGFEIPELDRDRDEYAYNNQDDFKPTFSNADKFERSTDSKTRTLGQHWYSDNVHDRYWHTKYENLTYLALSSTISISCHLLRHPIGEMAILDTVNFLDYSGDTPHAISGLYSGNYIIRRLVRTISSTKCNLYCELLRDSGNFDYQGERR